MVAIKRQIVSSSVGSRVTSGNSNPQNYITVHQTGNTRAGANAEMHARLQSNGNSRSASWHYQVDDKEAIQSFEHTAQCWAAGDGRGPGNMQSVHVEICINSDGDYVQAVKNGAALVKVLMDQMKLPISRVKQHWDWSGKNCPQQIRAGQKGIGWNDFLELVEGSGEQVAGEVVENKPSKPSTGKKTISQMADEVIAKKHGDGHDNRRKSLGISAAEYEKVRAEVNRRAGVDTSKPAAKPTKEYVQLPASAKTWRTYRTNVQPVAKNSDWSLTPSAFGGLEYEVLARPQKDVVTINTSRGRRNIYVGSNTSARIVRK
ncbi:N-acetylmuramoyl-L-alanine amidase [Shouchella lehensis]|uniref:N-acetylmuramoyl-L-alanine amidase n=1 Tax=Shouchella lehensis G1 TaxID=1246626 RepID=A0A060M4F5_9BACI|nr:N-acetylmuramoyl-L-alanine amidase [Shouchella lehensis]AIC95428.1 N-acetylmuramoyl-L-alanine amidase [Shouchella lehensis G1]